MDDAIAVPYDPPPRESVAEQSIRDLLAEFEDTGASHSSTQKCQGRRNIMYHKIAIAVHGPQPTLAKEEVDKYLQKPLKLKHNSMRRDERSVKNKEWTPGKQQAFAIQSVGEIW